MTKLTILHKHVLVFLGDIVFGMTFAGGILALSASLRSAAPPEGGALFVLPERCIKARPSGELARQRLRGLARFLHSAQQIHQTFGIDAPADTQTPYRAYSYGISLNKL